MSSFRRKRPSELTLKWHCVHHTPGMGLKFPFCASMSFTKTLGGTMFEYSQRGSIPERFPRLTCFVIACGLLVTTLLAEIDYLRSSGYFWR